MRIVRLKIKKINLTKICSLLNQKMQNKINPSFIITHKSLRRVEINQLVCMLTSQAPQAFKYSQGVTLKIKSFIILWFTDIKYFFKKFV